MVNQFIGEVVGGRTQAIEACYAANFNSTGIREGSPEDKVTTLLATLMMAKPFLESVQSTLENANGVNSAQSKDDAEMIASAYNRVNQLTLTLPEPIVAASLSLDQCLQKAISEIQAENARLGYGQQTIGELRRLSANE